MLGKAGLTHKDLTDQRKDAIWEEHPVLINYVLIGLGCLVVGVAPGLVHFFRYHTSMNTQILTGDRKSR